MGASVGTDGCCLCGKPLVNLTEETVHGLWRLPFVSVAACLARLDETPTEMIRASASGVAFVATPRATVTILVR